MTVKTQKAAQITQSTKSSQLNIKKLAMYFDKKKKKK